MPLPANGKRSAKAAIMEQLPNLIRSSLGSFIGSGTIPASKSPERRARTCLVTDWVATEQRTAGYFFWKTSRSGGRTLKELGKLGSHLKVQDSAESLKTSFRQIADWLALSVGRQDEFTFQPGETDYQRSKNSG